MPVDNVCLPRGGEHDERVRLPLPTHPSPHRLELVAYLLIERVEHGRGRVSVTHAMLVVLLRRWILLVVVEPGTYAEAGLVPSPSPSVFRIELRATARCARVVGGRAVDSS